MNTMKIIIHVMRKRDTERKGMRTIRTRKRIQREGWSFIGRMEWRCMGGRRRGT